MIDDAKVNRSRRHVLASGLGVMAAGFSPRWLISAAAQTSEPLMTRPIPHSAERIPVIGLGTAINFDVGDDQTKRAALVGVIDQLIAGGGKLIDTASAYGTAEQVIGDLLSGGKRAQVFLATKVRGVDARPGTPELGRSLERLRSKTVDLLQLHNVKDPNQSMAMFRDWKSQGLCRYFGITTTFDRDYDAAEAILRREKPDFFQVDYSLKERAVEKRLLPAAADVGAAVLTALPFGRNSLFRAVRGKTFPDWAKDFDAHSWGQFFLKFLLSHPAVTAVIPGTNKAEHMADNLGAGRGRLPDAAERARMIKFFDEL